jgi:hypothetical protein
MQLLDLTLRLLIACLLGATLRIVAQRPERHLAENHHEQN